MGVRHDPQTPWGPQSGESQPAPSVKLTKGYFHRSFSKLTNCPPLAREQKENYVPFTFLYREVAMLRIFVEEAAALASIGLFLGMVAVWAQLIPQL